MPPVGPRQETPPEGDGDERPGLDGHARPPVAARAGPREVVTVVGVVGVDLGAPAHGRGLLVLDEAAGVEGGRFEVGPCTPTPGTVDQTVEGRRTTPNTDTRVTQAPGKE